jgi:transcriptional regulator with XRE-family HTH domain
MLNTTIGFLDALKALNGGASDYKIAKLLGVTHQTVSKWRIGKDFFGDSTAIRVANMLGIDPKYVVACAHAERAKEPEEKTIWQGIAALCPAPVNHAICIMLSRKPKPAPPQIPPLTLFGQLLAFS